MAEITVVSEMNKGVNSFTTKLFPRVKCTPKITTVYSDFYGNPVAHLMDRFNGDSRFWRQQFS